MSVLSSPSPLPAHAPPPRRCLDRRRAAAEHPAEHAVCPYQQQVSLFFPPSAGSLHLLSPSTLSALLPPHLSLGLSVFHFSPSLLAFSVNGLCHCKTVQAPQEGPRPHRPVSPSLLSPSANPIPPVHQQTEIDFSHCLALYSRPASSAWSGPRSSPTYSPAPANARLPNGNQQGPPGAFPPLANGARPSPADANHARILAQISGLTVRPPSGCPEAD